MDLHQSFQNDEYKTIIKRGYHAQIHEGGMNKKETRMKRSIDSVLKEKHFKNNSPSTKKKKKKLTSGPALGISAAFPTG